MTELEDLQRAFQRFLLSGDPAVRDRVVGTEAVDADERLGIYANAYLARLAEALGEDFPALRRLAGEPAFDAIARDYAAAYPSTHASIRWLGARLPQFLAQAPAYRFQPWLADLARFEWTLGLAFDGADADAVDVDAVAAVPAGDWPGLGFVLHPTVRRLTLGHDVAATWKLATEGAEQPGPPLPFAQPQPWLIWRRALTPRHRRCDPDEAAAIDAVAGGARFGAVCEVLCDWVDPQHAPARAAALLKTWVVEGLIAALDA
ncbi:MAG: DUF2063 domain-containing protein [Gammaproteobacteria bacterium]